VQHERSAVASYFCRSRPDGTGSTRGAGGFHTPVLFYYEPERRFLQPRRIDPVRIETPVFREESARFQTVSIPESIRDLFCDLLGLDWVRELEWRQL
jgi:hypothetical protein